MSEERYRAYLINLVQDVLQPCDLHQVEVVSVDPGFPLVTARPVTEAQIVLNFQRALNSQSGHFNSQHRTVAVDNSRGSD